MAKRFKSAIWIALALFCLGAILFWEERLKEFARPFLERMETRVPSEDAKRGVDGGMSEKGRVGTPDDTATGLTRSPVPKVAPQVGSAPDQSQGLPPSPPLPRVPPESSQAERREAFELKESVDHVVLKDEPFEAGGKQHTIEEIQKQLRGKKELPQIVPPIKEAEIGPYVRMAITAPPEQAYSYYGVRVVRPSENLWRIHFMIVGEYLARRHVIFPPAADQPLADGRSSGVGRLLKFMESVVFVYSLKENRLEKDLNLIHPDSAIVFFKISELFGALDQLKPEDLQWLRYADDRLHLDRPEEKRELLDRRSLIE